MSETKIEFAVQISSAKCVESVREALKGSSSNIEIDQKLGRVIINTKLPWSEIQDKIESTGRKAVLTGFGGQSAVSMISNDNNTIKGVVRFSAINNTEAGVIVDGVVDGLSPGLHGIHVHECGDLSDGCASLGGHYNPKGSPHGGPENDSNNRHAGDLGNIRADENGRATFRFIDSILEVWDIIGRSVAITSDQDDYGSSKTERSKIDGNCGDKIACGIIARSAGIFQNYKKICACDGVTLWDERDKPLAGGDRSNIK